MRWKASVEAFVYALISRDSHAFMNTFRNAKLTLVGGGTTTPPGAAETAYNFWSAWRDVDPGPWLLATHAPGPYNIDALYRSIILGATSDVGVEPRASAPRIRVYPPPATTMGYLQGESLPNGATVQARVYDVAGRLVRATSMIPTSGGQVRIPFVTTDIPNGVYFVRLTTAGRGVLGGAKRLVILH
jgi:hypothetical protein